MIISGIMIITITPSTVLCSQNVWYEQICSYGLSEHLIHNVKSILH